jgi:CysZ protein
MGSRRERRAAQREANRFAKDERAARRAGRARVARRTPGFWFGVGLLRRGFRTWRSEPGIMLLGLIPGVISAVLIAALVATFAINLDPITRWVAGFANGWPDVLQQLVQAFVAVGLIWAVGLTIVYGFTSFTLLIGQPFFEAVSRRIDEPLGAVPEAPGRPWFVALVGNIGERVGRLALAGLASGGLFLLSLIPVVGTGIAWTLGSLIGGWFLALELTDYPFERRGHRLRYRRLALGTRRRVTLGFGVAAFLLFLVPGGAVLTMSAAVAGGTLLTRHTLGEPITLGQPLAR